MLFICVHPFSFSFPALVLWGIIPFSQAVASYAGDNVHTSLVLGDPQEVPTFLAKLTKSQGHRGCYTLQDKSLKYVFLHKPDNAWKSHQALDTLVILLPQEVGQVQAFLRYHYLNACYCIRTEHRPALAARLFLLCRGAQAEAITQEVRRFFVQASPPSNPLPANLVQIDRPRRLSLGSLHRGEESLAGHKVVKKRLFKLLRQAVQQGEKMRFKARPDPPSPLHRLCSAKPIHLEEMEATPSLGPGDESLPTARLPLPPRQAPQERYTPRSSGRGGWASHGLLTLLLTASLVGGGYLSVAGGHEPPPTEGQPDQEASGLDKEEPHPVGSQQPLLQGLA